MGVLILGLVLFLGVHSVRIVANDWRTQVLAQRGEGATQDEAMARAEALALRTLAERLEHGEARATAIHISIPAAA